MVSGLTVVMDDVDWFKTPTPVTLKHDCHKEWIRDSSGLMVEAEIPVLALGRPASLEANRPIVGPEFGDWRLDPSGLWRKWTPLPIGEFSVSLNMANAFSAAAEAMASALKEMGSQLASITFNKTSPIAELESLVPALTEEFATCPVRRRCSRRGQKQSLRDRIVHLNDDHKWSRERIADWLETLHIDLTLQPASVGD